jgi:hypothetical protein
MANFSISAQAEKKDLTQVLLDKNKSYAATVGDTYLSKIPPLVDDLLEGFPDNTVVGVTVSGSITDAQLNIALTVAANPTGVVPS